MAHHFPTSKMPDWHTKPNSKVQQVVRSQPRFLPHIIPPNLTAATATGRLHKPVVSPAALRFRWSREYLGNLMYSRRPRNLPPTIAYNEDTRIQDIPIEQLVPEFTTVTVVGATGQIIEVKIGSRSTVVADEETQSPVRMDDRSTMAQLGQEATLWTDVSFAVSVTAADGERRDDMEWKARWTQPLVEGADSYHDMIF